MENFTLEDKKILDQCNKCYMLGVLATEENYFPAVGDEQRYITTMRGSNNIVFYVKIVSSEPYPIKEIINRKISELDFSDLYIGIDIHQNMHLPLQYQYNDIHEKMEILQEKFKNKLIMFKPKIKIKEPSYLYKNLEVISVEGNVDPTQPIYFHSVPNLHMECEEFEKKLFSSEEIQLKDFPHIMGVPKYIICGNYIYYNFNKWEEGIHDECSWRYVNGRNEVEKIKFEINYEEYEDKIIKITEHNLFMEQSIIDYLFMSNEETHTISRKSLEFNIGSAEIENAVEEIKKEEKISKLEYLNKEIETDETHIEEYNFIQAFKELTIRKNLTYDIRDLINFHICVKTNPLTIISGRSGTGKSQLALLYAKMLGLSDENERLLFLPISPTYTEPGDLLGYLNQNNKRFSPSETKLTDFLIRAAKEPNKMHMVIFDEMNLSQVEHWFAPFISLLEVEPDQREISLYSKNAICDNSDQYPHSIKITENVRFIGTVNIDETTKDFSDRLLDRANIITLRKNSFKKLREEIESIENEPITYEKNMCGSYVKYNKWISKSNSLDAFEIVLLDFFDKLNDLIQKHEEQKGVSFRNLKKIGDYLNNVPINPKGERVLSLNEAMDIQIKQRIITKIKGTERQYENLIGTANMGDKIPNNSELYEFFISDDANFISNFKISRKEILRKAKELNIYGYTS